MEKIKLLLAKLKGSHALMMIGCFAMLAAFMILPLTSIKIGNVGFILLLLACPAMHIFMMKSMNKDHQGAKVEMKEVDKEPIQLFPKGDED